MAPDDPLSSEPGEPFDLTLWRGGTSDRNATVVIKVRAYARRLAGGQPVGLLLIQDEAGTSNDNMRAETRKDAEVQELKDMCALREQVIPRRPRPDP